MMRRVEVRFLRAWQGGPEQGRRSFVESDAWPD